MGDEETKEPVYPHTEWVRMIEQEFETRTLTELEALGYTEALMFERMIEESIPSLRKQLEESKASDPDSLDARNAAVFLAVAMKLSDGLAKDVTRIREKSARVQIAVNHFEKDGQPS